LNRRIKTLGMAPIDFDVVDAPFRIGLGILEFVTQAPRPLLTSQRSCIRVETEFQSFAVDIIRKRFDAGRKSRRVGDDCPIRIAADLPAIVDVHVLVAGSLHPGAEHGVCCFAD
jgi:hypothetical protein